MVHEIHGTNLPKVRDMYPQAAIIRRIAPGVYVAFDQANDALGHFSASIDLAYARWLGAQRKHIFV